MIEITLPWPPSVNTYWRRGPRSTYLSKKGRDYHKAVADMGIDSKFGSSRLAVSILAIMPDKRRKRDLDNLLKGPLDAMEKAGVYVDDSQIDDLRIVRGPVCKPGRLEVCIGVVG